MFRYSAITKTIDGAESSILSNITKVKMYKNITPTLNSGLKYTLSFNNAFFNPHSGHNTTGGGIVSSTGFKINNDSSVSEHFLDDDGAGNIRVYYLSGTTRIYTSSTFGTINYTTGEIVLTSMDADGTKNGYDIEMTRAVAEAVGIPVVASGGAGSPEHLKEVLTIGKANAALAASIFHYNEHGIQDTKKFLANAGVLVRLT